MKGFSIIIVTWNGLHHLKKFLPSVAETRYPDFEIIIADNNSEDGSREWISQNYPDVRIAKFDDNYGYTGGNNRAVPYAEKEILLFLNNDVKVEQNWLYGLNELFEKDEKVAAAQPKIRSYNEPEFFEYAGAAGGYLDKFGYPYCRGRILDTVEKDSGQFDDKTQITWASGAALAIRKDVFITLGGFDEDFEFHMEEIDLCWRTLNAGYTIKYTHESVVYHLGGGSLPMGSARKIYYNFRNSLYMLYKNLPDNQLFRKLSTRIFLDIVAAIRSVVTGKFSEFGAIVKAHFHFWLNIKMIRDKRTETSPPKSNFVLSDVFLVSDYFIRSKKTYNEIQN